MSNLKFKHIFNEETLQCLHWLGIKQLHIDIHTDFYLYFKIQIENLQYEDLGM